MNPDSTVTISWNYFVELSDDGKHLDQPAPEVILMPPAPPGTGSSTAPVSTPQQEP